MSTPISSSSFQPYPMLRPAFPAASAPPAPANSYPAYYQGGYQPVSPRLQPDYLKPLNMPVPTSNQPTQTPSNPTNSPVGYPPQPYQPLNTAPNDNQRPGVPPTRYPDSPAGTQPNRTGEPPAERLDYETEESLAELNDKARDLLRGHPEWANVINNVNSREDIKALLDDPNSPPNDFLRKLDDYRIFRVSRRPLSWIGRGVLFFVPRDIKPDAKVIIRWVTSKPPERTEPSSSTGDYFSSRRRDRYHDDDYDVSRHDRYLDRYDDYDDLRRDRYSDRYGDEYDDYGSRRRERTSSRYDDYERPSRYRDHENRFYPENTRTSYNEPYRPERTTADSPYSQTGRPYPSTSSESDYRNQSRYPSTGNNNYPIPRQRTAPNDGPPDIERPYPNREPDDTRIGPRRYPDDTVSRDSKYDRYDNRFDDRPDSRRDHWDMPDDDLPSDRDSKPSSPLRSLRDRVDRMKDDWNDSDLDQY